MIGPPFPLHPLPPPPALLASPAAAAARPALESLRAAGGRPWLVGGFVRDLLRTGAAPAELDVEVRGLAADRVEGILAPLGAKAVGRSFGVFKLGATEFALPRRERKTGPGHRGFAVEVDPFLPAPAAAARRDLTINAMALEPWTGELLDPLGGRADLAAGILRHASPRFLEDPLRVLRVMQFAGRLGFAVAPETVALCRSIDLSELPRERIWGEWRKLLLEGSRPSLGLVFLERCGALRFFPELQAMVGTGQDPEWHPEGTVWDHTLLVLDRAAELRTGPEADDLALMLAALCHDLGKPATTRWDDEKGRIVSPRHEALGDGPTRTFLARLTLESDLVERVAALVRRHLAPHQLWKEAVRGLDVRPALRRLLLRVDPGLLERVARADHFGRRTPDAQARQFPAGELFLRMTRELLALEGRPRPLVLGRHLVAAGIAPGPEMGRILGRLFAAQLKGAFATVEEGLAWWQANRA